MRTLSIIKYMFSAVGCLMLVGALLMYGHTRSFIAASAEAEGTVIDLARDRDGSSFPVVSFVDPHGVPVEFKSSVGTGPPRYMRGEKVKVLYERDNPFKAEIDTFWTLWFGVVIIAALGGIFTAIGAGFFLVPRLLDRREEALRASGIPIETDFQRVEQNTSLDVNGQHPFRVVTQWLNPSTSELHVFKSRNLWFDPTEYLDDRRITVFIAPNDPKRYFVDLSFLPKLAD